MKIYSFEKLRFWDELRKLIKDVYLITKSYPDDEKFGIVSQMRRSAVSISSNIAEGSSRISFKDQSHFYQVAYSSLMELLSQFIVSEDLGYCSKEQAKIIRTQMKKISIQINALRKAQLNKIK